MGSSNNNAYAESSTETIDSSSLSLESVDDVHSSDGFSSGMFSVGHSISDDTLKESLKDVSRVVVDEG